MATTGVNIVEVAKTVLDGTAGASLGRLRLVETLTPSAAAQSNRTAEGPSSTAWSSITRSSSSSGRPARSQTVACGTYLRRLCEERRSSALALRDDGPDDRPHQPHRPDPASYAGDTVFATVNSIVFNNLGTGAVTITTGATNPAACRPSRRPHRASLPRPARS